MGPVGFTHAEAGRRIQRHAGEVGIGTRGRQKHPRHTGTQRHTKTHKGTPRHTEANRQAA